MEKKINSNAVGTPSQEEMKLFDYYVLSRMLLREMVSPQKRELHINSIYGKIGMPGKDLPNV